MAAELLDILSMVLGVLSLFFLVISIVIFIGFNVMHDINVLSGMGARKAVRKMRAENRKKHRMRGTGNLAASVANTGGLTGNTSSGAVSEETVILQDNAVDKTVLLDRDK